MYDVKILLSGPGLIGRKHAELIKQNEDCKLAAVVAPPSDRNAIFAMACGAPVFSSTEEALNTVTVDAAIISSPNAFHYDQAMACLSRQIPTLVEKPLSDRSEDAIRLVDAVEKTRTPMLVGHHRSYSPLTQIARDFLRSQQFGQMVALQGTAIFYKPDQYFRDGPWRAQPGGGPILINLIHEIGLMRDFAGEIVTVQALRSSHARRFIVEDTVSIGLEFENGALGTFMLSDAAVSWKSWEMTSGENPAYPHFPQSTCYHFAGSDGALDFPSMTAKTYRPGTEKSWWKPFEELTLDVTPCDPLKCQLEHFVDVIRGQANPQVSARDGYHNLRVVEAIKEAAQTGRQISLSTEPRPTQEH
ncbi:Gfo/Idh/MocA family oxidoreductase [Cognatiyoonia sp. IB215182]|uniref:Gfo/Idh/MocA family protein n=1 Tax=Cognatiyoonia sp. IB215182 TaxID=3097353 RepID=UPI002A136EB0|nr:Gfo/Idh/MocA family oxidoreductase [Cognatiyoonia sp. IB215182]MDX8354714.1 Gfo/Idh/MocA family oxidoreductase [Cognatiyoonia sp. IB215182]